MFNEIKLTLCCTHPANETLILFSHEALERTNKDVFSELSLQPTHSPQEGHTLQFRCVH